MPLSGLTFPILVLWLASLVPHCPAQVIDWRMPPSWKLDAEPTDLFFIDRNQGWIVGDRGLVLRTSDGGQNWEPVTLQTDPLDPDSLPVSCRLETVNFVSPSHGWIAGGYHNPGSTTSHGVLFATVDGGQTWKQIQGIALPKINRLMFSTPLEGIAVGDGNALKPSGVFQTRDGGRSWSCNSRGSVHSWQVADQANGVTVLATDNGQLGRFADQQLTEAFFNTPASDQAAARPEPPRIRQIRMLDERFGYAVADAAEMYQTRNGGYSWDAFPAPSVESAGLDLYTLSIQANRIWVAGNPGSMIWTRTTDQAEWQPLETPLRTPIARLHFVDTEYGWAVGTGGSIIHTQDGGKTWSLQRRGLDGVALLQVSMDAREFVPELFSRYCGDENYIGGAIFLKPPQREAATPNTTCHSGPVSVDVARQALCRVGGSFLIDRVWDAAANATAAQDSQVVAFLTRQIRVFRPRVIAIPSGSIADIQDIRRQVLAAVNLAADGDHPSSTGLPAWQVGKVVVLDRGDVSHLKIAPGYYMMELGALASDHAAVSRLLLKPESVQSGTVSLTTIFTSPFAAGPNNRLFGGIEITDAEVPVRGARKRTAGNMTQMRQLAGKRKTLDRLLEMAPQMTAAIWNNHLSELTMQLDDAAAGVWLFELANRCDVLGLTELAVQSHLYLTNRYRQHPLATSGFRWLFRHYSSAEQAHISIRQAQIQEASRNVPTTAGEVPLTRPVQQQVNGVNVVSWEVDDPRTASDNLQAKQWTSRERKDILRLRFQQARAIAQSFALTDATGLDWGRFDLARIGLNRRLDPGVSVADPLKRLASTADPALARMALTELEILQQQGSAATANNTRVCATATSRPWLDGALQDELWGHALQQNSHIPLLAAGGGPSQDQLLLAADDEFLYIAIRCLQHPDQTYDDNPLLVRSRDSQLSGSDRVEIAIDIDRDYDTCFLFSVDAQGRVAESFGNNLAWNPEWFVAHRCQDSWWIAEIAIPLEEISSFGDYWSIAVSRHLRNRLISHSWQAAAVEPARPQGWVSLHEQADQHQATLQALPLSAFQWIKMPWSETKPAIQSLPEQE